MIICSEENVWASSSPTGGFKWHVDQVWLRWKYMKCPFKKATRFHTDSLFTQFHTTRFNAKPSLHSLGLFHVL